MIKTLIPWQVVTAARRVEVRRHTSRVMRWKRGLEAEPKLERPIFMIGCPRSGTTLCARLYGTHPNVVNWSEAGLIWDPARYYDPQADHFWGSDDVNQKEAKRLHATFEHHRQMSGKERFFNKHPRNSVRIDFLQAVFPDAIFIHVIRDGRAVVNSILNKIEQEPTRHNIPFGRFCKPPEWRSLLREDPVEQAALQWREILSYILSKKEALGDRYFEVSYEAVCANPRERFKEMFAFAGLSASESDLAGVPAELESKNFKFREAFNTSQLATIESVQEKLLTELGYQVETPSS